MVSEVIRVVIQSVVEVYYGLGVILYQKRIDFIAEVETTDINIKIF